jgi:hypothetical protein
MMRCPPRHQEKQSAAITELGATLRDAIKSGQDVPKAISELANRLKQLTQQREQAERELTKFDNANEPPSVIQARIKQREAEVREALYTERTAATKKLCLEQWADLDRVIQRCPLITAALSLEGSHQGVTRENMQLFADPFKFILDRSTNQGGAWAIQVAVLRGIAEKL